MKKIFTLIASLMMVLSMSAATKTIYCKMAHDWWYADGAAVGAHYWIDNGAGTSWPGVRMTPVTGETDLWSIDIDTDKYKKIIFTRVNGSGTIADYGAKTADLTIPTDDKNLYTITSTSPVWGDPGCTGTWSTYTPNAPKTYKDITFTITANAAPQIHYWDGGDKMVGSVWENLPTMTATGNANEYTYTVKDVDEAKGVKYLLKIGNIQTSDQITSENVIADFKDLMPEVYVKGVTGWNGDGHKMTIADDCASASVTITLAANLTADLKLTIGGNWMGDSKNAITKENNSSVFDTNGGQNGSIKTDIAGDYVFTYTYADQTLTVTYPTEEIEVAVDCYVTGNTALTGEDWVLDSENLKMTKVEGTEKYTYTFTALPANTAFELKVVYANSQKGFSSLSEAIDGVTANGDNICFTLEETGDVTVTYDAETEKIALTGNFAIPVTYDYYIAGTLAGGWSATQQGMAKEDDVYKHTFSELDAGTYEFKVTNGTWTDPWGYYNLGAVYEEVSEGVNDEGNPNGNIKFGIEETKNITVTFNPATGKITIDGLTEITEGLTYTVETPWGTENCYIASATTGWNFRQMEPTDEDYIFTITIVGAKETDEYKYACQPNWDFAEVREADENGNTNRKAWTEKDVVDEWSTLTYTVAGNNAAVFGAKWDVEIWENNMTLQEHDGTYVWTKPAVYLTDNVEFKVIKNQNWEIAWPSENYVINITESAFYSLTIYYNPANNDITVVTNKLTAQTGSLTLDGVILEEVEYGDMNLLVLSGASSDWTTEVGIYLENYTGEDNAYNVYYESAITYNYNYSMYNSVSGQLTQTTGVDGLRTFTGTLNVAFEGYDEETDASVVLPYQLTLTLVEKSDAATVVVVTDATVTLDAGLTMTGTWTDLGTTYPVLVTVPGFDPSVASAELEAAVTVGGGDDDPWLGFVEGLTTVTVEDGVVKVTGVLENTWAGVKLDVTISGELPIYTRTVASGSYGTICLPNGSVKVEGAKFYEVTFKKDGYIYADEVTTLDAGMPYIFHATSTEIKVYYNETTASAGSKNGVYGTFSDITDGDAGTTGNVLEGKYLLVAGPQVQKCAGNCSLAANRAYFVVSEISDVEQQSAPGRQRIALGCQDENQATGLDNITENGAVAPALQGTYDILGRQLSEPAANGFYIINGKKVLVVK